MLGVMIKIVSIICILIFSVSTGSCDELSKTLERMGFVESDSPKGGEWRKANHDYPAFEVSLSDDGSLLVQKPSPDDASHTTVSFDAEGVKYTGVDFGEFGGGLYLGEYSKDKTPIFGGNVRALLAIEHDLYIVEGLAHMGFNGGSIQVIRDYLDPSPIERVTLLPEAPLAAIVDDSMDRPQIAIVGYSSFMVFTPDSRLQMLQFDTFYGGLYPSSVVRYGDFYIIGIRSGIAAVKANVFWKEEIRYFKKKA